MICLSARSIVDGVERDLGPAALVIRINRHTPVGRELADHLGLRMVPSFVVYDEQGGERLRHDGGLPNRQALIAALRQE